MEDMDMGQPWHQTHDFPAVGQGAGLITSLNLRFLIYKMGTVFLRMPLMVFISVK